MGGLGAAVGPKWGPGATPPEAEHFFSMSSQKKKKKKKKKASILEHENQIFASQRDLDQTFTWPFSK